MADRSRPKREKVHGKLPTAHFASGLSETLSETVRLWRKHHLAYDQTKYVVEQPCRENCAFMRITTHFRAF